MRKWLTPILLIAVSAALAFGGYEAALQSAYARVESLTGQYGAEVQPALSKALEKEGEWEKGALKVTLEYFKIFEIAPDSAKVFVVMDTSVIDDNGQKMINREGEFKYLKKEDGCSAPLSLEPFEQLLRG